MNFLMLFVAMFTWPDKNTYQIQIGNVVEYVRQPFKVIDVKFGFMFETIEFNCIYKNDLLSRKILIFPIPRRIIDAFT